MTERGSQEHQFRHQTQVSLEQYHGVAHDIVRLNDRIVDGFMRVSDIRKDVVIVSKPEKRVTDYDQLGFVRVGKFIKLPNFNEWTGNDMLQTKKENDCWIIAINDQELARNVARTNTGDKKINDLFIDAFQHEVQKGLRSILKKEKLLNAGEYDLAILLGTTNAALVAGTFTEFIYRAASSGLDANHIKALLIAFVGFNLILNLANLGLAGSKEIFGPEEKIDLPGLREIFKIASDSDWQEPFVKHSPVEYMLPVIPIDRLIRGLTYLDKNGDKLIDRTDITKK